MPDRPLFAGSVADFERLFAAVLGEVGFPDVAPRPLTPASLRPGGATWLFQETDSPEVVRFRGRWLNSRMLEIYIPETATHTLWVGLDGSLRSRILELGAFFHAALGPL